MKVFLSTLVLTFVFCFPALAQSQSERDKGVELYRQGEFEKAVEVLQEVVKTEKNDSIAWLYMGACYVKLNKNKEATKAFRQTNAKEDISVYDRELKIESKPRAQYTDTARQNYITGKVKVAVEYRAFL